MAAASPRLGDLATARSCPEVTLLGSGSRRGRSNESIVRCPVLLAEPTSGMPAPEPSFTKPRSKLQ